ENKTQARVLEAEEVRRLIDATPKPYRVLVGLLAYTGLRISEALGLVWDDVDLDASVIKVRMQLSRPKRGERARRVPLKTKKAARAIDLAPEVERMLREHRRHALELGHARSDGFVFCTLTGAPMSARNAAARGLDKGANSAGLNPEGVQKLSFHDL